MKLSEVSGSSPTKLSDLTQSQEPSSSESATDYLGMAGAAARGLASNVLGTVGDIQQAVNVPFNMAMRGVGLPQYQAGHWPTTGEFENILPGQKLGEEHPTAQTVGEWLPAAASLGYAAEKAAVPVGKGIADVVPRMMFGATKRAEKSLQPIVSAPTDNSIVGERISKYVRGHLDRLWNQRSKVTSGLRDEAFSHNEVADRVRGKLLGWLQYIKTSEAKNLNDDQRALIAQLEKKLSRNKSIEGLDLERRDLADFANNTADTGSSASTKKFADRIENIFRDQLEKNVPKYKEYLTRYRQMSEPINMFTDTALGKRVSLDVSKRLDLPKYDPATLPKAFFKSKASVQALLRATGGNKEFVNQAAADHAANALAELTRNRPINESATAARNWLEHHREWLDQVPKTEKAVEQFVSNLEKTKHVQRTAKFGAGGALLLYLAHPVWALRSLIMGM